MSRRASFLWPTDEQLEREIRQSQIDARRIRALEARHERREMLRDLIVALFIVAVGFVFLWAASGQTFHLAP